MDRRYMAAANRWWKSVDKGRMTAKAEIFLELEVETEFPDGVPEELKLYVEDGTVCSDDYEVTVPIEFVVCHTCDGRGAYVNPNVDSHGITEDERERGWDDESWDSYLSGGYDVTCGECNGDRVVPQMVKGDKVPKWVRDAINQQVENNEVDLDAEAERRAGC